MSDEDPARPRPSQAPLSTGIEHDATDWALIARARSGDSESFGELYDRHFDEVHGYIGEQVRDRATHEQLTARTFFAALRSLDSLRIGIDPPRAWLLRIAADTVRDHLRAGPARDDPDHESTAGPDRQRPTDGVTDPDEVMIRGLVRDLPRDQRRCLELRYLDGLGLDEIAERMGRSPGAVTALHHRAVLRLQRLIDQDLPAAAPPPDRPPTMPRSRTSGTRPSANGTRR